MLQPSAFLLQVAIIVARAAKDDVECPLERVALECAELVHRV